MDENALARLVVDAAYRVHRELGPGLLESVYERVLAHELGCRHLTVRRQAPISIHYRDMLLHDAFRADLVVEDRLLVELKSLEQLAAVHYKQLLTYLRLTDMRLGLLINFGAPLLRNGIRRVVNGLEEAQ